MGEDEGERNIGKQFVPLLYRLARRCQSKILNTWSGHRTAQIDPEKCKKINGREIRF
jgi:hypothetical protein